MARVPKQVQDANRAAFDVAFEEVETDSGTALAPVNVITTPAGASLPVKEDYAPELSANLATEVGLVDANQTKGVIVEVPKGATHVAVFWRQSSGGIAEIKARHRIGTYSSPAFEEAVTPLFGAIGANGISDPIPLRGDGLELRVTATAAGLQLMTLRVIFMRGVGAGTLRMQRTLESIQSALEGTLTTQVSGSILVRGVDGETPVGVGNPLPVKEDYAPELSANLAAEIGFVDANQTKSVVVPVPKGATHATVFWRQSAGSIAAIKVRHRVGTYSSTNTEEAVTPVLGQISSNGVSEPIALLGDGLEVRVTATSAALQLMDLRVIFMRGVDGGTLRMQRILEGIQSALEAPPPLQVEALHTARLYATPVTTTHNLPEPVSVVTFRNLSRRLPARVTVSGKLMTLSPGGVATVRGEGITSFEYASEVGTLTIEYATGPGVSFSPLPPDTSIIVERFPRQPIGVRDRSIYSVGGAASTIRYSDDLGQTWTNGHAFGTVDIPHAGHITAQGTHIVCTKNGKIYRSTDNGQTYTLVLDNTRNWLPGSGVKERRGTIVFAEYGPDHGTFQVWRSVDDGETWTSVLSVTNPTDIRHFHSVDYDEFERKWYVTAGDDDPQCKWFVSSDDAQTFEPLEGAAGSQLWRTLRLVFDGAGRVLWGTDTSDKERGIYIADVSDIPGTARLLYPVDTAVWGIGQLDGNLVAVTQVENYSVGRAVPSVLVSRDFGETWRTEFTWPLAPGEVRGGFRAVYGPDADGRFYLEPTTHVIGRGVSPDNIYGGAVVTL